MDQILVHFLKDFLGQCITRISPLQTLLMGVISGGEHYGTPIFLECRCYQHRVLPKSVVVHLSKALLH